LLLLFPVICFAYDQEPIYVPLDVQNESVNERETYQAYEPMELESNNHEYQLDGSNPSGAYNDDSYGTAIDLGY